MKQQLKELYINARLTLDREENKELKSYLKEYYQTTCETIEGILVSYVSSL
jgi:hypothetical protein